MMEAPSRSEPFQYRALADADDFLPVDVDPDEFSGPNTIYFAPFGDPMTIEYIIGTGFPDDPHGLSLRLPPTVTGDCIQDEDFQVRGDLSNGDHISCTVTYHYDLAAYVEVIKETICPTGFSCPPPSDNIMNVEASGSGLVSVRPQTFRGSNAGTLVTFAFTADTIGYEVTETPPPPPSGLVLVQSPSEGCNAVIGRIGEVLTCTFTNEYRVAPTTP